MQGRARQCVHDATAMGVHRCCNVLLQGKTVPARRLGQATGQDTRQKGRVLGFMDSSTAEQNRMAACSLVRAMPWVHGVLDVLVCSRVHRPKKGQLFGPHVMRGCFRSTPVSCSRPWLATTWVRSLSSVRVWCEHPRAGMPVTVGWSEAIGVSVTARGARPHGVRALCRAVHLWQTEPA